jgi:pimeloyl-ACP methyl ester carboxylesterase
VALMVPETQYVESGGYHIAYQVVGDGGTDLMVIPGFASHLEAAWEEPRYERWFRRMASFSRLILIDKRGTGLSDRVQNDDLPTLEERMQDVKSVLDAIGSIRTAFFGISEGGATAALFAASNPDRTTALVLSGSWARAFRGPDYPWGFEASEFQQLLNNLQNSWGKSSSAPIGAPSLAHDVDFTSWWARFQRQSASPGAAAGIVRMAFEGDVRHVLPAISCPTLVLHRTNDPFVDIHHGRYLAEHIPGARMVELDGGDHLHYVGDTEVADNEVELFLTGTKASAVVQRVLATVMFTDIVGSTKLATELGDQRWQELLEEHNKIVRREIERHDGIIVNTTGDGFLARFDGPARAVRCAQAAHGAVSGLGLQIRSGLHVGEVQIGQDDISGIAVHIGARVMASANAGETRVTSTIRDLVVGSGLGFIDLGQHELKGIPGSWTLMSVESKVYTHK